MEKINFCEQWNFKRRDSADSVVVRLPHDAMITEKRKLKNPSGSAGAYFPGGVYEYAKDFHVPEEWLDKCITFCFEGVYKNSTVYINNQEMGGCAYGYSHFYVDTAGALKYGADNTIKVVACNDDQPNSRWYTGSGIYRPVWLLLAAKNHIDIEGVKVTTLSYNPAKIRIDTAHTGGETVAVEILDNNDIIAGGEGHSIEIEIPDAKLWSDATPYLYNYRVKLLENGNSVDEVMGTFGIRLVEWNPKGLFLNGKETLLRGGCVHHDNGILGARSFAKYEERRVRMLKEAGFNAIRSSHNPASVAMLDACDQLGMYMIDETWDMWYNRKSKYDYANDFTENYEFDIRSLVSRDYNHPSVIMYSIANEVSEPATEKGVNLTKKLVNTFHALDSTRPVTAGINLMIISRSAKGKAIYKEDGGLSVDESSTGGMNSTMFNMITSVVGTGMNKAGNSKKVDALTSPCLDALDIAGYNYASGRYPLDGKAHPGRLVFGSETFPQDIAKNWGSVKKYPYLIGDFMWTAWDYLGEAGIGAWAYTPDGKVFNKPYPWLLADVGVMDLLGNPGGGLFLAQAAWGLLKNPAIAVRPVNHPGITPSKSTWRGTNALPSWSWRGCEGNKAVAEVYSDADTIELKLNGRQIGKKKVKGYKAIFKLKYAPGTLIAIAYAANGRKTGESQLTSAQSDIRICLISEETTVTQGELVFIDVKLADKNGVVEMNADAKLTVTVENGELLAFGSANPRTEDEYNTGIFTTYFGRAQAIVRCTGKGILTLNAAGEGLASAAVSIEVG